MTCSDHTFPSSHHLLIRQKRLLFLLLTAFNLSACLASAAFRRSPAVSRGELEPYPERGLSDGE